MQTVEVDQVADLPARAEAERDRLNTTLRRLRAQEKRETAERDRLSTQIDEVARTSTRLEAKADKKWVEPPIRRHPSDSRVIEPHWEVDLSTLPLDSQVEHAKLSKRIEALTEEQTSADKKLHSTQRELEAVEQALALAEHWLDNGLSLVGPATTAAAERLQADQEVARLETELAAAKARQEQADRTWTAYEHRLSKAGGKAYLRDILDAAQQQENN